ncbi:hypothetical protein JCM10449v2_002658 [Rhodotorula kratochvilovae]
MGRLEALDAVQPRTQAIQRRRPVPLALIALALAVPVLLGQYLVLPRLFARPLGSTSLHLYTNAKDRSIDWSWLHHSHQCPHLAPIHLGEFSARRDRLASVLAGEDGQHWGAYISEPSANSRYYLNVTQSDWSSSERPWLAALTPSAADLNKAHLSILTPAFERSRSERLPFALTDEERADVSWVTWEEADDPYEVLLEHLAGLRAQVGAGAWSVEVEENVRTFVRDGLAVAAQKREHDPPTVGLARIEVRELRMRKTAAEAVIQHCVAKITLEALRAVRKHVRVGMTEQEGEALITNALHAGGLTDVGVITLFSENAALPHASASATRRLKEDEFALFDVDGSLFGYQSDFTRTMLPDPPSSRFRPSPERRWPSPRAERIWTTVRAAQQAALDALLTPNGSRVVHAAEVDRAARAVIEQEGWGEYFTHRLGHGIGFEVHEPPFLHGGNTAQALLTGETFSNEPGVYIERGVDPEGLGIGVRLEDMVRKTEEGWELVSGMELARSPWEP